MLLLLLSVAITSVRPQDLSCPTGVASTGVFYIIGASGGDSTTACENTAAATTAGLRAGMNAVELDVSVSQDKVVFLWNDPKPTDPVAQARSQGLFVNGMCRPAFNTILGTRDIVFSQIRKDYIYLNSSKTNQEAMIPTLHEWMDQFAANTQLQMIILDLKIGEIDLADYLVDHIMTKADALSVRDKIRLVSGDFAMAAALQSSLARATPAVQPGYNINIVSQSFGGTAGSIHIGYDVGKNFDAVTTAKNECYGLASIGQTTSTNGWREYQSIMDRMVKKRDELVTAGGNYIPVIGWRISKIEKVAWMMCAGVDGIMTDNVLGVWQLRQNQLLGSIQCCMEDKMTPCLSPVDPRLLGQGCSSMGLSWYDYSSASCQLLGTVLNCRQLKFCAVSG